MKIKSIIALTLLTTSLNSFSQENVVGEGYEDTGKILENNTKINKDQFIIDYYKKHSSDGRVSINSGFELVEPLHMNDVVNLNHPYYQKKLKLVKEKGIDALGQEMNMEDFDQLRNDSIYNEAVKFGIQSALYRVLYNFKGTLDSSEDNYKTLFDFSTLMLADGKVKPPVIIDAASSVKKENKYKLRSADADYIIYEQAEVVLRAPSYLDYLSFEVLKPKEPETLLLPSNDEEWEIWRRGVYEGWIVGIKQGNSIISEGYASLYRDFYGMHVFHTMVDANIVTMPTFERIDIGTTTDGKNLRIGEVTFKVAVLPEFNDNTQLWKALSRLDTFINKRL